MRLSRVSSRDPTGNGLVRHKERKWGRRGKDGVETRRGALFFISQLGLPGTSPLDFFFKLRSSHFFTAVDCLLIRDC